MCRGIRRARRTTEMDRSARALYNPHLGMTAYHTCSHLLYPFIEYQFHRPCAS